MVGVLGERDRRKEERVDDGEAQQRMFRAGRLQDAQVMAHEVVTQDAAGRPGQNGKSVPDTGRLTGAGAGNGLLAKNRADLENTALMRHLQVEEQAMGDQRFEVPWRHRFEWACVDRHAMRGNVAHIARVCPSLFDAACPLGQRSKGATKRACVRRTRLRHAGARFAFHTDNPG